MQGHAITTFSSSTLPLMCWYGRWEKEALCCNCHMKIPWRRSWGAWHLWLLKEVSGADLPLLRLILTGLSSELSLVETMVGSSVETVEDATTIGSKEVAPAGLLDFPTQSLGRRCSYGDPVHHCILYYTSRWHNTQEVLFCKYYISQSGTTKILRVRNFTFS
jgi:hypothetical protein